MKSKIDQTSNSKMGSFKFVYGLLLMCIIFGYIGFKLMNGWRDKHALKQNKINTKAVVINERSYFGNSPVSQQFAYSYAFVVNEKKYVGKSRDPSLNVGDSVTIEYVATDPSVNQLVSK